VAGLIIDAGVPRRRGPRLDGFPGVVQGHQRPGHGEGDARLGQRPRGVRRRSVRAGDVIVADVDGVVVIPRAQAAEVARLGADRVAKEQKTRERLRAGELGLDFYGLRARLAELGVRYLEEEEEDHG